MDMLCIAAAHDPIGYVAVAGRGLDSTSIARMTGGSESEVQALLAELDRNGVFSRDRHSRIYSRRMVSDAKKAAIARANGLHGGNPNLRKGEGNRVSDNPPVKAGVGDGVKTHKPVTSRKRKEAKASSLSTSERAKASSIGDGFPDADAIERAEQTVSRERSSVNVAQQAKQFRAHALTNDRQAANWQAAWDGWIIIEIGRSPRSADSPPAALWSGPADIRQAVVDQAGEPLALGYLDRCAWRDIPDRAVVTTSPTTAERLKREVGDLFDGLGVEIVLEAAA